MSEDEQIVDDCEEITPLQWTKTFIDTHELAENMTPLEAYSIGFKDGYHYGTKQTVNLFAQHMAPHDVASIIGG